MSTKKSYILKQTCSWKLQVYLSRYDLLVEASRSRFKGTIKRAKPYQFDIHLVSRILRHKESPHFSERIQIVIFDTHHFPYECTYCHFNEAVNLHRKKLVKMNVGSSRLMLSCTSRSPLKLILRSTYPLGKYLFKFNNKANGTTLMAHSAFTCSKVTIQTLEQGVKYVQS